MNNNDPDVPCGGKDNSRKLGGWEFYEKVLGSPKYVVAPMVDQSELAWRMLCRKYGAHLCYSPMFHSNLFSKDVKYRKDALQTCPEDRPLIIQFCGNDPQTILDAALLAQDHCDAIDINLGCPQAIAKRGHYGAFLQDEWKLLRDIVSLLNQNLSIPVTCKIRIFEDRAKTIEYAKLLEEAGCQLLTVHGRTREQKGPLTGIADWSYIKEVRENIGIPMFANGNILSLEDVNRCLDATGVQGIMSAEGNLHNPAIFAGISPKTYDIADEYLDYVKLHPCPISYIRGHLFKIFHHLLNLRPNSDLREKLATSREDHQLRAIVSFLKEKYEPIHNGEKLYVPEESIEAEVEGDYNLSLPPWICQPYIRLDPEIHKKTIEEKVKIAEDPNTEKRKYFDEDGNAISRKKAKRLKKKSRKPFKPEGAHERNIESCPICSNPLGFKCIFKLCRNCCREKCTTEIFDCQGHRFFARSKFEGKKIIREKKSKKVQS
ncbi:DUS1L family protein [Megaselia abdita]